MDSQNIVNEILSEFLKKTSERKIIWALLNPNVLRWRKPETQIIVTLQKQPSTNPAIKEIFVFTIQEGVNKTQTQISTATDPTTKNILSLLFNVAADESKRIADEKKIETLKKLLEGIE